MNLGGPQVSVLAAQGAPAPTAPVFMTQLGFGRATTGDFITVPVGATMAPGGSVVLAYTVGSVGRHPSGVTDSVGNLYTLYTGLATRTFGFAFSRCTIAPLKSGAFVRLHIPSTDPAFTTATAGTALAVEYSGLIAFRSQERTAFGTGVRQYSISTTTQGAAGKLILSAAWTIINNPATAVNVTPTHNATGFVRRAAVLSAQRSLAIFDMSSPTSTLTARTIYYTKNVLPVLAVMTVGTIA